MLAYDALLEQARLRGMPPEKIRGILREYLQVLILKELHRTEHGRKLFFTGGTYLRLAHDTRRFSEDLDFNAAAMTRAEFEAAVVGAASALTRLGVRVVAGFRHWGKLYAARLTFPSVEREYGVVSRYSKKEGIAIKLETNNPSWRVESETLMVSGFGEMYPVRCTSRGALFADKIDALARKNRARHLYDIIFMLSRNWPVDGAVLKAVGIAADPLAFIADTVRGLGGTRLRELADQLRPFLFDEREADLIVHADTVVPQLLDRYRPAAREGDHG